MGDSTVVKALSSPTATNCQRIGGDGDDDAVLVGRCGQPTFKVCPLFDSCHHMVRICGVGQHHHPDHPVLLMLAIRDFLILLQLANVLALCCLQWLTDYENFCW